ncbi:MAG: hypothetical protein ABFC57_01985 [Veillonellales bacterium]|jgi:hypothetical protein
MGKNISVYLDDNLSSMIESFGMPPSKVIKVALNKFFLSDNRQHAFDIVASTAKELGKNHNISEIVKEWRTDRSIDRW